MRNFFSNMAFHNVLRLGFIFIVFAIATISVVISFYLELQQINSYKNRVGLQIASAVSRNVFLPLVAGDREGVEGALKSFFPEKGLFAIGIYPESGSPILETEKQGYTLPDFTPFVSKGTDKIIPHDFQGIGMTTLIIKDIFLSDVDHGKNNKGKSYGKVLVVLSDQPFLKEWWDRIGLYIALLTVYLLAGMGFAVFVTKIIEKRVKTLDEAVKRFREGDMEVNFPGLATNDVISSLAKGFLKLQKDLRERGMAVLRSKENWESTFNSVSEPIFLTDSQGIILNANKALTDMFNKKKVDVKGRKCNELFEIPSPAELPGDHARFDREIPSLNIYGDVSAFRSPGFDFWVYFIRDITKNLELQKQLTESQKFESLGTMAAGTAHEFNNVLQGITGYAELLQVSGRMNNWPEKQMDGLDKIVTLVDRAKNITGNLLSMAHKKEKREILADLVPMIKEKVKASEQIAEPSIRFIQDIDINLWIVRCDPGQVDQAITNLIVNAMHAMKEKGGDLTVEAKNVTLPEGHGVSEKLPPGDYVQINVADTGIGISSNNLTKIFDPFFTTKKIGEGTGLGLSTSLGIIESFKGDITVKSQVNQGSTFSIYLPAEKREKMGTMEKDPQPITGDQSILIVEDELIIREELSNQLSFLGYNVQTAEDGSYALGMIEKKGENRFDVIILDVLLPSMDGEAFLKVLRGNGDDTPVVVLTGYAEPDKIMRIRQLGVRDVLSKPCSISAITHAIHGIPFKKQAKTGVF